jgi:hypothetical protein
MACERTNCEGSSVAVLWVIATTGPTPATVISPRQTSSSRMNRKTIGLTTASGIA